MTVLHKLTLFGVLGMACAPTLTLRDDEPQQQIPAVSTTERDGLHTTEVDASDYDAWVYFSFQSGEQALPDVTVQPAACQAQDRLSDDPSFCDAGPSTPKQTLRPPNPTPADAGVSTGTWDLAFQRFHILSNGGVSGCAGVVIAALAGVLSSGIRCPSLEEGRSEYLPDATDGDDDNALPDNAFNPATGEAWYDYDDSDNSLSPRPNVYCVHTPHGTYAMQLTNYYSVAGGSGYPQFQWQLQ